MTRSSGVRRQLARLLVRRPGETTTELERTTVVTGELSPRQRSDVKVTPGHVLDRSLRGLAEAVAVGWRDLVETERQERAEAISAHDERVRLWVARLDEWQHTVLVSRRAYVHTRSLWMLLFILWSRLLDPRRPSKPDPHREWRARWRKRFSILFLAAVVPAIVLTIDNDWHLRYTVIPTTIITLFGAMAALALRGTRPSVRVDDAARRQQRTLTSAVALLGRQVLRRDGPHPELAGARVVTTGIDSNRWMIEVVTPPGVVIKNFPELATQLETHYRAKPGTMSVRMGRIAGHYIIERTLVNPFVSTQWPGPATDSVRNPLALGRRADGDVTTIGIRCHTLIAGITDAGKSGVLNVIIASLSQCADAELWGVDLKGGVEFAAWEPVLTRFADSKESAKQLFLEATTEMQTRQAYLRSIGKRNWEPSAEHPDLYILVDELAEARLSAEQVTSLARMGRATGVWVIAATQYPTADVVPSQIRNQFAQIIGLRVQRSNQCAVIFGPGWEQWDTSRFPEDTAGLLYVWRQGLKPVITRAYWVSDDDVRRWATTPRCVIDGRSATAADPMIETTVTELDAEFGVLTLDDAILATLAFYGVSSASDVWGRITERLPAGSDSPSERTVRRRLSELESAGRVCRVGNGPATRWTLP